MPPTAFWISCLFSDTTLICQQTAATVPSAAQCAKNSERGGPKWLLSKTVAKVAKATAFTKFFIASKIESSRSFVFVSAWDSEFTSLMSPKRRESKHRSLNARYWRTDSLRAAGAAIAAAIADLEKAGK